MAEKKNRKRRSLGRKTTGGKYKKSGKKKKYQLGHQARIVKLKETKAKILKVRGGNEKLVLLTSNIINLIDKNIEKNRFRILYMNSTSHLPDKLKIRQIE